MTADRNALNAESVSKRYGRKKWALRDVTIRIGLGEVVALLGPNGAGKSTLLKAWAGFERPTRGTLEVAGHGLRHERHKALNHISYVAQGAPLLAVLSAGEHLALARSLLRSFDSRAFIDRLERLAIPATVPINRLSGGQRAQVALGLALANPGDVLLLDEPLATLDPLARRNFMTEALESCRASSKTLVVSSHVVSDVDIADGRLILLDQGAVRLDAAMPELVRDHYLVSEKAGIGEEIGRVPGRESPNVLVKAGAGAALRSATLEDVVLGYLAATPS